MPNGQEASLKLWQVIASQIPWVITILALGGWQAAKVDSRLASLERAVTRIEVRQERDESARLEDLRQEIERMRKAGR